jgi:hypothetical protein
MKVGEYWKSVADNVSNSKVSTNSKNDVINIGETDFVSENKNEIFTFKLGNYIYTFNNNKPQNVIISNHSNPTEMFELVFKTQKPIPNEINTSMVLVEANCCENIPITENYLYDYDYLEKSKLWDSNKNAFKLLVSLLTVKNPHEIKNISSNSNVNKPFTLANLRLYIIGNHKILLDEPVFTQVGISYNRTNDNQLVTFTQRRADFVWGQYFKNTQLAVRYSQQNYPNIEEIVPLKAFGNDSKGITIFFQVLINDFTIEDR